MLWCIILAFYSAVDHFAEVTVWVLRHVLEFLSDGVTSNVDFVPGCNYVAISCFSNY